MSIKTVLLTGGRAPVTLDLARALAKLGCRVVTADTYAPTLCHFSRAVDKAFKVRKPTEDRAGFLADLEKIRQEEQVDLIIPLCEETLFVAHLEGVFSMGPELLEQLHNKKRFAALLKDFSIQAPPETEAVEKKVLYKRIFSRSGVGIVIKEAGEERPTLPSGYLAQEFIEGRALCSYSVAREGKVVAHTSYEGLQTMEMGASLALKSCSHAAIEQFVHEFAKAFSYTGQISFDFIENKQSIYCIECNPRATSGLHLFNGDPTFARAFLEDGKLVRPKPGVIKRDLLISVAQRRWPIWRGSSPIWSWHDPLPYLALPLLSLRLFKHKSFAEFMSTDIEFNGEATCAS